MDKRTRWCIKECESYLVSAEWVLESRLPVDAQLNFLAFAITMSKILLAITHAVDVEGECDDELE